MFDRKTGSGANVNDELSKEYVNKAVIEKLKRSRMYVRFQDSIWEVDLAEIGSLSSKNCAAKNLIYVIDVFSKYTWVKSLKDQKQ